MDSIDIYNYSDCKVGIIDKKKKKNYLIKMENDFFFPSEEVFHQVVDTKQLKHVQRINDKPIVCLTMCLIIYCSLLYYFFNNSFVIVDRNFIISTLILLFNIVIHECSHILTLKMFCHESKIKMGFKFIFIYPAFYVDTSYSYFLPKFKRIAVYLAGNTANCVFILVSMIFFPEYNKYLYLIVSNTLINFLPIVKSDGYYAFVSLYDKYSIAKSKQATYIEDFVRGMIMFGFLELLAFIT